MSLPALIEQYAKAWSLYDLKAVENLSYHYVYCAKKKDFLNPVILKIGVPSDEFSREVLALQHYNGVGAVEVLEFNHESGVVLLNALQPGTTLKSFFPLREQAAISITCEVIKKLHSIPLQANNKFPMLKEWHRSLYEKHDNVPLALLEKAKTLSEKLIDSQSKEVVLLHADLHHENILQNHDNWLAIDPKGVIGEPEYEVGAFIRNPMPELMTQSNIIEITSKRLTQFSEELNYNRQRLKDWSFVQAVLSACWSDEEGNVAWVSKWIDCAEVIARTE